MCPGFVSESSTRARRIGISSLIRYRLLVVALVAFILCERYTLAYFWGIWTAPNYYYSHGVIVPLLSGIMIWMNKGRLRNSTIRGSWIGVPILLLGAAMQIVGLACGFGIIQAAAFLPLLYGALIAILGYRVTAKILFLPALFLVTMIPLPEIILDSLTARFQIASTTASAMILRLLDSSVTQHGNDLTARGVPGLLTVGVPCSGLKLLITLVMCAWFLSYVLEGQWWKKAGLVALSFPLSLAMNLLRVVLIGTVGLRTHSESAVRSMHEISGYVELFVCMILVLGFARLVGIRYFRNLSVDDPSERKPAPGSGKRFRVTATGYVAIALMLVTAALSVRISELYDLPKGHLRAGSVPVSFGSWTSRDVPIDSYSRALLNKADLSNRLYLNADPRALPVLVFMDAAFDISMFHDPRLCMPGAGETITSDYPIKLRSRDPDAPAINASLMRTTNESGYYLIVSWYTTQQGSLASKNAVNSHALTSRLGDLGRLAENPFSISQVEKDIRARQITWTRFVIASSNGEPDLEVLQKFIYDFLANADTAGE